MNINTLKQKDSIILHISMILSLSLFLCSFILIKSNKNDNFIPDIRFEKIESPTKLIKIANIKIENNKVIKPKLPKYNIIPIEDIKVDLFEIKDIKINDITIELDSTIHKKMVDNKIYDYVNTMPKIVYKVKPKYPSIALKLQQEALILVSIVVTKEGLPKNIKIIKGHDLFNDATRLAVEQYKFTPGIWNGEKVNVKMIIPVKYKLK